VQAHGCPGVDGLLRRHTGDSADPARRCAVRAVRTST
jgi:hypothetical protein